MQRARAFFYVCAGRFLLALTYYRGTRSGQAQAPGGAQKVAILTGMLSYGETIPLLR